MTRYEYRVRWRREQTSQSATKILQTKAAAERKAQVILAIDEMKDGTRFADMPDLREDGKPVIQRRVVGEWEDAPEQVTEVDDEIGPEIEEWITPGSQSGVSMW